MDMGPLGTYQMYGKDGRTLGGMMNRPEDMPAPPHWLLYTYVGDLDAALAKVRMHGGQVLNGPMNIRAATAWRSAATRRTPRSRSTVSSGPASAGAAVSTSCRLETWWQPAMATAEQIRGAVAVAATLKAGARVRIPFTLRPTSRGIPDLLAPYRDIGIESSAASGVGLRRSVLDSGRFAGWSAADAAGGPGDGVRRRNAGAMLR